MCRCTACGYPLQVLHYDPGAALPDPHTAQLCITRPKSRLQFRLPNRTPQGISAAQSDEMN